MTQMLPAIQMATEDEYRALRIAVSYALRQGLASDDLGSAAPNNQSLVSVARQLGVDTSDWERS